MKTVPSSTLIARALRQQILIQTVEVLAGLSSFLYSGTFLAWYAIWYFHCRRRLNLSLVYLRQHVYW